MLALGQQINGKKKVKYKRLLIYKIFLLLTGCAAARMTYDGMSLIPPSGISEEKKIEIIYECNALAHLQAKRVKPFTEEQKKLLKGRATKYFYRHGTPVVNADNTPAQHITAIPPVRGRAPKVISDRYVVCFLEKGYSWPESK